MIDYAWREVELTLTAAHEYRNPYADVELWVELAHSSGVTMRRPAFWDGGRVWRVRFASPLAEGHWVWRSFSSIEDTGLAGQTGQFVCAAAPPGGTRFERHGFW